MSEDIVILAILVAKLLLILAVAVLPVFGLTV